MAKLSKEERIRIDGFEYFVSIYKNQDIRIPEIDEEIRRRNLTGKPIGIDKKSELAYEALIQKHVLKIAVIIYTWILHNKLGFGEKRLIRAIEWFWEVADQIDEDYVTCQDFIDTLKEECGLEIKFDD